jgi:SAM-dependent methyltransferase
MGRWFMDQNESGFKARLSHYWHVMLHRVCVATRQNLRMHLLHLRRKIGGAQGQIAALSQDIAVLQRQLDAYHGEMDTARHDLRQHIDDLRALCRDHFIESKLVYKSHEQVRGTMQDVVFALEKLHAEICQTDRTLRIDFAREMLRQRHALASGQEARTGARLYAAPTVADDKICPIDQAYQAGLERLRQLCPHAYSVWHPLLEVNKQAYDGLPVHSCSVAGHDIGEYFGYFARPYLNGRVLDIGCGPQPVPNYLADYPAELISGIDPLEPAAPHPFDFVCGVAEYLPWRDGTFGAVIAATSLDHVLVPDLAFQEVVRVLAPGGNFLTWVAFVRGAARYDPFDAAIKPIDAYHLFHFSQEFFEDIVSKRFRIMERTSYDGESYFYCLRPKATLAAAA